MMMVAPSTGQSSHGLAIGIKNLPIHIPTKKMRHLEFGVDMIYYLLTYYEELQSYILGGPL